MSRSKNHIDGLVALEFLNQEWYEANKEAFEKHSNYVPAKNRIAIVHNMVYNDNETGEEHKYQDEEILDLLDCTLLYKGDLEVYEVSKYEPKITADADGDVDIEENNFSPATLERSASITKELLIKDLQKHLSKVSSDVSIVGKEVQEYIEKVEAILDSNISGDASFIHELKDYFRINIEYAYSNQLSFYYKHYEKLPLDIVLNKILQLNLFNKKRSFDSVFNENGFKNKVDKLNFLKVLLGQGKLASCTKKFIEVDRDDSAYIKDVIYTIQSTLSKYKVSPIISLGIIKTIPVNVKLKPKVLLYTTYTSYVSETNPAVIKKLQVWLSRISD